MSNFFAMTKSSFLYFFFHNELCFHRQAAMRNKYNIMEYKYGPFNIQLNKDMKLDDIILILFHSFLLFHRIKCNINEIYLITFT